MMQAVEDSLRRLQTDYIDLYQSHRDDRETPIEETLSAYADLIKQGKVREIGASNFTCRAAGEALQSARPGLPRYESLQPHYNLVERARASRASWSPVPEGEVGVIPYLLPGQRLPDRQVSVRRPTAEGRARGAGGQEIPQ